jgi:hypothetical protein
MIIQHMVIRSMNAEAFKFKTTWCCHGIDHKSTTGIAGTADYHFFTILGNTSTLEPNFYTSPVHTRSRVNMTDKEYRYR